MSESKRPHLLYVAWGYPPSRGAGMYRALATANAFVEAGWEVTVLTATRETFEQLTGTDAASEASIDPRVDVVRVDFDLARAEPDLRRWSRWRVASPLLWNWMHAQRGIWRFPERTYGHWRRELVAAARKVHTAKAVTLVIGTANPNVDFAPGAALNRRGNIPYVMDYRDTWHLDVYSGQRTSSRRSRSSRLESRLLARASEVWFVNDAILDWHAREYPVNSAAFHVVANGYDSGFLQLATPSEPGPSSSGFVFGYLGTIYGPMPLRESLEGWRRARTESATLAASTFLIRGRLGHYASPDEAAMKLIAEYAGDGVHYGGPVSKTEVSGVYNRFDALLLILGKSHYVTSGKVFEYAATGLPIVSLHDKSTASGRTLDGYPSWFQTPGLDASNIADTLIATADHLSGRTAADIAAARDWASHLSRSAQLAPRIAHLTASLGSGQ